MTTHRETITRKTRLYQAAAVLLFAGAAAGIALPVGKLFAPAAAISGPITSPTITPPPAPTPLNVSDAANILAITLHWKKGDQTETPAEDPSKPPTPPAVSHDWTYSGSMMSSSSRAAIVKVDGQQHLLREGEKLGDSTLASIEPDSITIRTGGVEKKIALQARAQAWPTDATPPTAKRAGGPPTPARAAVPGQPAGAPAIPTTPQTFENRNKVKPGPNGARSGVDASIPGGIQRDDHREALIKILKQSDTNQSSKVSILQQLGIVRGMEPGVIAARLREMGLEPVNDPSLNEAVRVITGTAP